MIKLDEVEATIQQLENEKLTLDSCQKLAILYSVRDHNQVAAVQVTGSVLPSYNVYCQDKRKYQLGQLPEVTILEDLKYVCSELLLFMQTLYGGTNSESEREQLREVIQQLTVKYL